MIHFLRTNPEVRGHSNVKGIPPLQSRMKIAIVIVKILRVVDVQRVVAWWIQKEYVVNQYAD